MSFFLDNLATVGFFSKKSFVDYFRQDNCSTQPCQHLSTIFYNFVRSNIFINFSPLWIIYIYIIHIRYRLPIHIKILVQNGSLHVNGRISKIHSKSTLDISRYKIRYVIISYHNSLFYLRTCDLDWNRLMGPESNGVDLFSDFQKISDYFKILKLLWPNTDQSKSEHHLVYICMIFCVSYVTSVHVSGPIFWFQTIHQNSTGSFLTGL